MKVLDDDLWFCEDCALYIESDDPSFLSAYLDEDKVDERVNEIEEGIRVLYNGRDRALHRGDDEQEFSRSRCDCCCSRLAGKRYQFALVSHDKGDE